MTDGFKEETTRASAESIPSSNSDIASSGVTAPYPEAAIGPFCTKCGTSNVLDARFCNKCGAPLSV
jgi:hypothetical protein